MIRREQVRAWLRRVFAGAPTCEHEEWRPCVMDLHAWKVKKPARICADCNYWEPLTDEQFFAQFWGDFLRCGQHGDEGEVKRKNVHSAPNTEEMGLAFSPGKELYA